jgi:hypothetical protein
MIVCQKLKDRAVSHWKDALNCISSGQNISEVFHNHSHKEQITKFISEFK